MSGDYPQSMVDLKAWIEAHRNQLLNYVRSQPDDALIDARDAAGWSAKDHLAHLARWERSVDYLLNYRPRHEGLGVSEATYRRHDIDLTNHEIFQGHKDRELDGVLRDFDDVHANFLRTLESLTWDDLHLSYAHYAPDEKGDPSDNPVAFWVAGNTYAHYDEHLRWIRELIEPTDAAGS